MLLVMDHISQIIDKMSEKILFVYFLKVPHTHKPQRSDMNLVQHTFQITQILRTQYILKSQLPQDSIYMNTSKPSPY